MQANDWTEQFNGTRALPALVRARLEEAGRFVAYKQGDQVFGPARIPDSLFFLSEGRIRVSQTSEAGREIVLYRVDAGESCVLTTACMLAQEAYAAEGIAETDVTVVSLPKATFDQLVAEEPAFRTFVFAAYSRRLIDMMRVIDDVAFGRIDVRLAERLLNLANSSDTINATHQHLASELGTAREVISRTLHDFLKRGMITQTRGRIQIIDRPALRLLVESA